MDSGLEERILPSIRRSQIILIYRKGGVVNPETCGQIACSVGRLPIRFTVGTGGTIRMRVQAARSKTCTGGRIAAKNNLGLTEQAALEVNLAGHEKDFLSCYRFCFARFGRFRHVPTRASDHAFPFVSQRDVFAQL